MFGYDPDDIALACTFELSVDSTGDSKAKTYKFTVPETHSVTREIALGVTGSDWPGPDAKVNAWKLVLKSPTGKILTQKHSWLWEDDPDTAVDNSIEGLISGKNKSIKCIKITNGLPLKNSKGFLLKKAIFARRSTAVSRSLGIISTPIK